MANIDKKFEKYLAPSVRSKVRLIYWTERKRGDSNETVNAQLLVNSTTVLSSRVLTGGGPHHSHEPNLLFYEALRNYAALSIDEVVRSNNFIVRAIGMLDSRLGIRRLSMMNVKHENELVRELFYFRCHAEKIQLVESPHSISVAKSAPHYAKVLQEPRHDLLLAQQLHKHKSRGDIKGLLNQLEHSANPSLQDHPLVKLLLPYIKDISKSRRADKIKSLKFLANKSKLVNEQYLKGLLELLNEQCGRREPVDTWMPKTHNADRQLSSLARHLFAQYEVPEFLNRAWTEGNRLHQEWFKHIGSGKNIRTASELPIPLTKMMAHHFLTAHEGYTVHQALRRAQALAAGADERMAYAIAHTRLSHEFKDNEFWLTVISFFARNPMLDITHVGPIVDFIWNQKYVDVMEFVERGVAVNRGPTQPNFSIKGRSVNALLQQVERWHHALGKAKAGSSLAWSKSSIPGFELVEGCVENKNMRIWRISELLSGKELQTEGRVLEHCVSSYSNSCYLGTCSIWSLSIQSQARFNKLLTIEVNSKSKTIVQVRGKLNRQANDKEHEIVQRWATQVGLRYLRC